MFIWQISHIIEPEKFRVLFGRLDGHTMSEQRPPGWTRSEEEGHYWVPGTPKPSPDVIALIEEYAEMEDDPDEIPDWARQLLGT